MKIFQITRGSSEMLVRIYIAEDVAVQYTTFWGWTSSPVCRPYTFVQNIFRGPQLTVLSSYTRWYKYERDWFVCKQAALVPVIFEPPCIYCWSHSNSRRIRVL